MPIAFPAQPGHYCVIPRSTELYQFADSFSHLAPLFPVAYTNTTPEPMIHLNGIVVLQGDAEVVHPTVKIAADVSEPASHRDAPTATGKTAQLGLEAHEGFLRDRKPLSGKGETEENAFLGLYHTAFVLVVTSHIILIPISYERLHLSETTDRKLPWLPVSRFSDDLGRGNANVFGRHHPALFMSCREQSSFGEEVCPSEQSP